MLPDLILRARTYGAAWSSAVVREQDWSSERTDRVADSDEQHPPVGQVQTDEAIDDPVLTDQPPLELSAEAERAAKEPGSPLPRFWEAIKRLPRYARVAASLIGDPDVPKRSKLMLGAGGLYLASPIDLVPGVIPVAGQLDDLYVLLRALRQALHSAPAEVSSRHLHRVDLTMGHVEMDIKVIEETTVWLVRQGITAGGRVATKGLGVGGRAAAGGWRRVRALVPRRDER